MANETGAINRYGAIPVGEVYPLVKLQLAASQTLAVGDWFIINSAGQVEIALATSGSLGGVSAMIVSSSSAGDVFYAYAHPLQEFEMRCSSAPTLALLYDSIGAPIDIEGATGVMELNADATTEGVLQVVSFPPSIGPFSNDVTLINARARVKCVKHHFGVSVPDATA